MSNKRIDCAFKLIGSDDCHLVNCLCESEASIAMHESFGTRHDKQSQPLDIKSLVEKMGPFKKTALNTSNAQEGEACEPICPPSSKKMINPGSEPDHGPVSSGTPCTFNEEDPDRVEPLRKIQGPERVMWSTA